MATKDHCLLFKDDELFLTNDSSNARYTNLNLNQNQQYQGGELLKVQGDDGKQQSQGHYYGGDEKRKDRLSWNQSGSKKLPLDLSDFNQNSISNKKKDEQSVKGSTLSLHIEAYENNNISISSSGTKLNTQDLIKKYRTAKEVFEVLTYHHAFEFPRQQENVNNGAPEVGNFKATQKLLDPNATTTSATQSTRSGTKNAPKQQAPKPTAPSSKTSDADTENNIKKNLRDVPRINYGPENFTKKHDKGVLKTRQRRNKKYDTNKANKKKAAAATKAAPSYREPSPIPSLSSLSDYDYDAPDFETPDSLSNDVASQEAASDESHLSSLPESFYIIRDETPSEWSSEDNSDLSSAESDCEMETSMDDNESNESVSNAEYPDISSRMGSSMTPKQIREYGSYPNRIFRNLPRYWKEVQDLKQQRKEFFSKLNGQLKKNKKFSFAECREINSYIGVIEKDLNLYIPVAGKIKAYYVKGTSKDRILKRGFIYDRVPGSNKFRCPHLYPGLFRTPCTSTVYVDENDLLTAKSIFSHFHPVVEPGSETDDPMPHPKEVSFPRVCSVQARNKDYTQLLRLLKDTSSEVHSWKIRCEKVLQDEEYFKKLLEKMALFEGLDEMFTARINLTISETRFILERVYIKNLVHQKLD